MTESHIQGDILIVDDSPENLKLLAKILTANNFQVRGSNSGRYALKSIKKKLPDLILLDINMPEMNGYEVCRQLKNDPSTADIPVIFISGLKDNESKIKGFEAGGVDYVTKPFQAQEILARVRTHLSMSRMKHHLEEIVQERTAELQEVTEQIKAALKEKEVLLKEIHHRVKNNMAMMSSFLQLQIQQVTDPEALQRFIDTRSRIYTMALVHEKLYHTEDLKNINIKEFIHDLAESLIFSYTTSPHQITLNTDITDVSLNLDRAIPCGLIINELVSNALKHAFPKNRKGIITIGFATDSEEKYILTVSDDGVGLPEQINIQETDSIGLKLVPLLSSQLDGEFAIEEGQGASKKGTTFKIAFP
ncbi:MAG: response regulator [Candidatus Electrothrix sp. GW3-4]|uniref:response regulator n=1 Tax=Candidatus Electrothrix sp. GW3-4 TaxID=3126740 RepID=UPI0030D4E3DF